MDESAVNFNIFSLAGDTECVIKLQGDIDLRALPRLRGALRYAISGKPGRLIVDLTEASSVDVEGLAVLAAAYDRAKSVGTPLLLQAPNAATMDLLEESGFDLVLPVIPDHLSVERLPHPSLGAHPRRPFPSS
jgi:anti-anti-sigma factor